MKASEKRAQLVTRFHEMFKGLSPVEKIAAHPESADYYRELVADTGTYIAVVEDESLAKGRARFIHGEPPRVLRRRRAPCA